MTSVIKCTPKSGYKKSPNPKKRTNKSPNPRKVDTLRYRRKDWTNCVAENIEAMIELKCRGFRRYNMGWKSFTEEEILELKSNKYTHTVSASSISFTAEFKEKF